MRICENGIYRDMTEEEINAVKDFNPYEGYSYEELVRLLMSEKYTIEDEIGIINDKEDKPEEYSIYMQYRKECKAKARNIVGKGDG